MSRYHNSKRAFYVFQLPSLEALEGEIGLVQGALSTSVFLIGSCNEESLPTNSSTMRSKVGENRLNQPKLHDMKH